MRRAWLLGLGLLACAPPDEVAQGRRFVEDRAYRRATLEASLVNPANRYSRVRLASYALASEHGPLGWDAYPEHNPAVRPWRPTPPPFAPVFAAVPWTHEALMALGERAFFGWPAQPAPEARGVDPDQYGLWVDADGWVGGLVEGADGQLAWTCASCHATPDAAGRLVPGLPHVELDAGALRAHHLQLPADDPVWRWGPGQVDVTTDGLANPVAIPDLRPVRYQSHLHWAGTIRNDLPALAVRIDTLLITAWPEPARPPRQVAFALAWYLWHLAPAPAAAGSPEGAAVFARVCAGCHGADGTVGAPVALDVVGTDAAAGRSPERGTGAYRVPSLAGVGARRQLLHTGAVASLAELLDPDRAEPGHPFGQDLDAADRAALLAWLATR